MRRANVLRTAMIALFLVPCVLLVAQQSDTTNKRAKPPRFDDSEFDGVFFKNVFDATVGDRPTNLSAPPSSSGRPGVPSNVPQESQTPGAVGAWAQYVSPSALEDELKAIKLATDKNVTTPTKFRSGGYKANRLNFSVAAMIFAVISEYDGDVRWKDSAPGARDLFARTAGNCKVGSIQAFNEAKVRKADLQDLVGGGAFQGKPTEPGNNWEKICDRSPLMQRIEESFASTLKPLTANASDFKANTAKVMHEAELVALIGEVLTKEGMEDGDDDDYAAFARTMRDAARDVVNACKDADAGAASKAVGVISQSCSECHENYRG